MPQSQLKQAIRPEISVQLQTPETHWNVDPASRSRPRPQTRALSASHHTCFASGMAHSAALRTSCPTDRPPPPCRWPGATRLPSTFTPLPRLHADTTLSAYSANRGLPIFAGPGFFRHRDSSPASTPGGRILHHREDLGCLRPFYRDGWFGRFTASVHFFKISPLTWLSGHI